MSNLVIEMEKTERVGKKALTPQKMDVRFYAQEEGPKQ